ncbi:hypothetical protein V8C86DRAFT_2924607 [Haematococcus lacustris]
MCWQTCLAALLLLLSHHQLPSSLRLHQLPVRPRAAGQGLVPRPSSGSRRSTLLAPQPAQPLHSPQLQSSAEPAATMLLAVKQARLQQGPRAQPLSPALQLQQPSPTGLPSLVCGRHPAPPWLLQCALLPPASPCLARSGRAQPALRRWGHHCSPRPRGSAASRGRTHPPRSSQPLHPKQRHLQRLLGSVQRSSKA